MKKNFIEHLILVFFSLRSNQSELPSSRLTTHLALVSYFLQTLSVIFKIHYDDFINPLNNVFASFFIYSNYANMLIFLNNPYIFMFFYVCIVFLVIIPYVYLLIIAIFNFYSLISIQKMMNLTTKLNSFFNNFLNYFIFIILIPSLEVLMSPFNSDWERFWNQILQNNDISHNLTILSSVFAIVLALLIGVILLYSNKNYEFHYNRMDFELNSLSISIFMLRTLQIIVYPIIKKNTMFFYGILYIIGGLAFVEYYHYSSLKNQNLNNLYLAYLLSYQTVVILLSFWSFTNILNEETLLYLLIILWILAYKLGIKLYDYEETTNFMIKSNDIAYFDTNLSKLKYDIFFEHKVLYRMGYFKNHFHRQCNEVECLKLLKEIFLKNTNMSKRIDQFIKAKFIQFYNKKIKNDERKTQIILKYINFLLNSSANSVMLLFEFEKAKRKLIRNTCFKNYMLKFLAERINEKITQDDKHDDLLNNNSVELYSYFKFIKEQKSFLELIKEILNLKKQFWKTYLSGFKNLQNLFISFRIIVKAIDLFERKLKHYMSNTPQNILILKLKSMLYSILYNDLNKALKYETDFDNMLSNEQFNFDKMSNKLSFLNKDIVTCEASFFDYEGIIKPISKTEKLAKFFGYNESEMQSIVKIEQFMPKYLQEYHKKFIQNYLNTSKSSLSFVSSKNVKSYALNKNNCIFPITVFFGICHSYENDFVLKSAILPESKDQMILLYSPTGVIIGFSSLMQQFFQRKFKNFNQKDSETINIFDLISELKIITENNKNNDVVRGLKAILIIPMSKVNQIEDSVPLRGQNVKKSIYLNIFKKYEVSFEFKAYNHAYAKHSKLTFFSMNIQNISRYQKGEIFPKASVNFNINAEDVENYNQEENIVTESDLTNDREYPKFFMAPANLFNDSPKEIKERISYEHNLKKPSQDISESPNKIKRNKENKLEKTKIGLSIKKDENISLKLGLKRESEANFMDNSGMLYSSNQNHEVTKHRLTVKMNTISLDHIENKNQELFSKHSSVMKIKSKNSKVFNSIEKIKKHIPKYFYFFFMAIMLEIIAGLLFSIIFAVSQETYFDTKYYPTKLGMINFGTQYSSFSFATAIMIELENQYLNLTNTLYYAQQNIFFHRILNRGFISAKMIVDLERGSTPTLNYQLIYQNYQTWVINIDSTPKSLQSVTYFELLDFYLTYMQYVENEVDFKSLNYDFFIFLQRNFPYFLAPSAVIFNEIQNSFNYYNNDCNTNLMMSLILFLVMTLAIKFFQIIQLLMLNSYMTRLISIFLRINSNDALKELCFIEELTEELKEKEGNYLDTSYAYKCSLRQKNMHELKFTNPTKIYDNKQNKPKGKKFKSNLTIQPFSQKKNFLIMTTSISISFCFYFFNYYYWLQVNSTIKEFISINISFASIYVYSSSILTSNNNCIRELIITNNSNYQAILNNYQDQASRITYFLSAIDKRIPIITSVASTQMPGRIFQAESYINDENFNQLVKNDICELLYKLNKIQLDEAFYCKSIWDGSLTKGLLISIDYYVEMLRDLGRLRNKTTDIEKRREQIQDIYDYLADPDHVNILLGDYFLNQALFLFYQYINNYYDSVILDKIKSLKLLLIITVFFFIIILIVGSRLIWKNMMKFHITLGLTLSLMPYDKITEDEATYQIINNFLKG